MLTLILNRYHQQDFSRLAGGKFRGENLQGGKRPDLVGTRINTEFFHARTPESTIIRH